MRQGDLFLPLCARHVARQARLFDPMGPAAVAFQCPECGHWLERTPSGWLAYPLGHGRLMRQEPADPQPEDDEPWARWIAENRPAA
jgi:hypothetical protein